MGARWRSGCRPAVASCCASSTSARVNCCLTRSRRPRAATSRGAWAAPDDFIAAAEFLVKRGDTQPSLLGLLGRGDGARVVGVALTRRPDLFRAAVLVDGRYDLLGSEREPDGEVDVPQDRAQFDALVAASPLRAVRDGGDYPALLLLAGEGDGRVDPAQSRKMAARLQQADPNGRAILFLTDKSSGPSTQASLARGVDRATDVLGFLLHEIVAAQ